MHFDLLDLFDRSKFEILKSNMAASAILKIQNIAICRPRFEPFLQNLAWLRSSNLLLYYKVSRRDGHKSVGLQSALVNSLSRSASGSGNIIGHCCTVVMVGVIFMRCCCACARHVNPGRNRTTMSYCDSSLLQPTSTPHAHNRCRDGHSAKRDSMQPPSLAGRACRSS